ncbi:MAG: lasso peptide biosynthesis B2 protein [Flavobacteriaceae bacterium]
MLPFPPPVLPFAAHLWVSARLMPVFAQRKRLDMLLKRATPPAGARAYDDMAADEIATAVKRAVARPWRMRGRRCLREGLLAFHYLALSGRRPVLRFGIDAASVASGGKVRAHCWVSLEGRDIVNEPAPGMSEIMAYDGTVLPVLPAGLSVEAVGGG